MKYSPSFRSAFAILFSTALIAGCGSTEKKRNAEFHTSGSPEADQRADQRMAKAQQLKGAKADTKSPQAEANKSLYERLGGDKGVIQIVDDFVPRVLADPRVNFDRSGMKQGGFSIHRGRSIAWNSSAENVQALKNHLAQFLALATGGPAIYDGREMTQVHSGMQITNAEFDASVGDLKASLDKLQVPVKEQKELLAVVETTRSQIAEKR